MNCQLCGSDNHKVIADKLRHGETRNVLECEACGLIRLEPKDIALEEYYRDQYRKLYTPVLGEVLSSREIFEIYLPYQKNRIDGLRPLLTPEMKVLEIGCSAGYFLYAIKEHVQECVGIEFNSQDAAFVNRELGIKTYTVPLEDTDIPLQRFDLIAVLQVLEHIEDPLGFLANVSRYLKPGGHLFIKVPNVQEGLLSVYGVTTYKDFYFKEPHIFYYSPKTLEMLMEKAGFHGEIKTVQRYNIMNQLHWLFTGKPQQSATQGMSAPILVTGEGVAPNIRNDFNRWIQKVDTDYRELLRKYGLGESIWFLGRNDTA